MSERYQYSEDGEFIENMFKLLVYIFIGSTIFYIARAIYTSFTAKPLWERITTDLSPSGIVLKLILIYIFRKPIFKAIRWMRR